MHATSLDQLLQGLATAPPVQVTGLALDSRRLRAGEAFVALRGHRGHGLAHLSQALAQGAGAILWEPAASIPAPRAPVPCVEVEGLSVHVGEIAARYYGRPSEALFVAGITGSDGKTSTAHLIAQSLSFLGRDCGYIGTLGVGSLASLELATHTTPDAISVQQHLDRMRGAGLGACAMEVSSHALDQHRVGAVQFDVAVLTNLSRDHLDYHGTVQRYAAAKRRLFEADDGRALVLNRDDAHGARWIKRFASVPRLRVYGIEGAVPRHRRHALARRLQLHARGVAFDLHCEQGMARVDAPLLGRFNVYNLLATAAVLLEAGHGPAAVAAALAMVRTVPGRIETFAGPGSAALVVVDYAHTPKALEQVLLALRPHAQGALHCVFGCGGDRDRGKRPLMGEVAARLADRLTVTDDNPRNEDPAAIVGGILSGIAAQGAVATTPVTVEHDRGKAIATALRQAREGDVVLIAGKGHETTQHYAGRVLGFSDRQFVAQCLEVRP